MNRAEAVSLMEKRFQEHPELGAVAHGVTFDTDMKQLCEFFGLDVALVPVIANEVWVVLALYAPVSELGKNIAETAKIDTTVADKLAAMIEHIILGPVLEGLMVYDELWQEEVAKTGEATAPKPDPIEARERLDLRPEGVVSEAPAAIDPATPTPFPMNDSHEAVVANLGNFDAPRIPPSPVVQKEEQPAKPLTREELMSALSAKRTMASDMKAAQDREAGVPPRPSTVVPKEAPMPRTPVVGYGAAAQEKK